MKNNYLLLLLICFIFLIIFVYFQIDQPTSYINLHIRLPRLLLTLFTGIVLGCVGYSFQILMNNPLAEPYILGISSGAALFSMIATISGLFILAPLFGFGGALITMWIVWQLANHGHYFTTTKLLLSGIIISMFFSAFISLLMYLNQQEIGLIINILMGNLGRIFSVLEFRIFIGILIICTGLIIYLFSKSSQLTIITMGDEIATSLGVPVKSVRKEVFVIASFLTGIIVSYAGIIGFIGLIVPHITRMISVRKNNLLCSSLLGGILLLLCDLIAMHIAVIEVPVGIVTAFLGCPFFIFLMLKNT